MIKKLSKIKTDENYLKGTLYKYRSLENFRYFMDILVNERLYACKYSEMNDYMEGHYLYRSDKITKEIIEKLRNGKEKLRICSLTEDCNNDVMLAHYADGGKGVILGVEILEKDVDIKKVMYGEMPKLDSVGDFEEEAKAILTNKLESWSYESEVRIFTNKKYVKIRLKEIIFGPRTPYGDKELIKKIIDWLQLDANIKSWGDC